MYLIVGLQNAQDLLKEMFPDMPIKMKKNKTIILEEKKLLHVKQIIYPKTQLISKETVQVFLATIRNLKEMMLRIKFRN